MAKDKVNRHQRCSLLVVGGSAGSLEVILKFLPELRVDLNFGIVLVLHRKSGRDSMLTQLLAAKTRLKVKEVEEKETLQPATVYIVPPNYHLLIENNHTFSLDASEKVNFSRPAIDVTFESASEVFGEELVCLLLSGSNNDGTLGLQHAAENGGRIFIQDPSSASSDYMPANALQNVEADAVLLPEEMGEIINRL